MRVTVKLHAMLGERYTPEGVAPGEPFAVELPERSTVADLVAQLGVRANEVKVVYVNGEARAELYRLRPADEVGFFPPIGGG